MFKTDKIEKLVECCMLGSFINDEGSKHCPLSLMLIAPPETAKTSILLGFNSYKALEATDMSPKSIRDVLIPKLDNKEINCIVIPDMLKILSHKSDTVKATITFFNALMEEGVKDSMFYGQEYHLKERATCGIITSITTSYYNMMFSQWNDIGFTSRFLPVAYDYSEATIREIQQTIQEGEVFNAIKEIKKGEIREGYEISIPSEIGALVCKDVQRLTDKMNSYVISSKTEKGKVREFTPEYKGFRLQKQSRQLLKAVALMRDRENPVVTLEDYAKFVDLIDYINMPNTKMML